MKRESLPRMIKSSNQTKTEGFPMEQFTKDLTKTLLSNGNVKEIFRQQLEKAINQILQSAIYLNKVWLFCYMSAKIFLFKK